MVVDDEEALREIICEVLEMLDIDVVTAEDGLQAIEKAKAEKDSIDFFLIDLFMPNISGEETYRKLNEIFPNRPVVFMSGFDKEAAPVGNGNFKFLKKPFTIMQLKDVITSLM